VLEDLKASHEGKGFVWKIHVRSRHSAYTKVRPAGNMCEKLPQTLFFDVYAHNLIELRSN
jgi:hypothetical protein